MAKKNHHTSVGWISVFSSETIPRVLSSHWFTDLIKLHCFSSREENQPTIDCIFKEMVSRCLSTWRFFTQPWKFGLALIWVDPPPRTPTPQYLVWLYANNTYRYHRQVTQSAFTMWGPSKLAFLSACATCEAISVFATGTDLISSASASSIVASLCVLYQLVASVHHCMHIRSRKKLVHSVIARSFAWVVVLNGSG